MFKCLKNVNTGQVLISQRNGWLLIFKITIFSFVCNINGLQLLPSFLNIWWSKGEDRRKRKDSPRIFGVRIGK